jgi:succinate dehydrogenase/fumarate reductase flavoprotein subunit
MVAVGKMKKGASSVRSGYPSPRLYVAGEISLIYGHLYLEAGNITECFVAGKIAGQNAAAEKAWD